MEFYRRLFVYRWKVIGLALVVSVGFSAITAFGAEPKYQAEAKLLVVASVTSSDSTELNQSAAFAQARVKTYVEFVASGLVLEPVIQKLDLKTTPGELAGRVTAVSPVDTAVITLKVTDSSPNRARETANLIAETFALVAPKLEDSRDGDTFPVKIRVVREAIQPLTPINRNPWALTALGALLGLALGVAAAALLETLSPRVWDTAQLQRMAPGVVTGDATRRRIRFRRPARADTAHALRSRICVSEGSDALALTVTTPDASALATVFALDLARSFASTGASASVLSFSERPSRSALRVRGDAGSQAERTGPVELVDVLSEQPNGLQHTWLNVDETTPSRTARDLIKGVSTSSDGPRVMLFECAGLLTGGDAIAWAGVTGKCVLVLERGYRLREARKAVRVITDCGVRLVAVVLADEKALHDSGGYESTTGAEKTRASR